VLNFQVSVGITISATQAQLDSITFLAADPYGKFVGTWTGIGTQIQSGITYTMQLDIFPDAIGSNVGELIGKSDYPSLECGGDLYRLETENEQFVLQEVKTYGKGRCAETGIIRLVEKSASELEWSWQYNVDSSSPMNTAILTRQ
jgi:hypothetical protein